MQVPLQNKVLVSMCACAAGNFAIYLKTVIKSLLHRSLIVIHKNGQLVLLQNSHHPTCQETSTNQKQKE